MFSVYFTKRDLEVVILSLQERENIMFNQSLIYKNQGNKSAQFDCIHEKQNAGHLRERLEKLINRNP